MCSKTCPVKMIDDGIDKYGSLRKAAEAFGVSPGYLSRVHNGKRQPGLKLANALGVKAVTIYVLNEGA